ncbi:MAG: hypothetical protein ACRDTG_17140 [Pseudonocardiaceae bacterium]
MTYQSQCWVDYSDSAGVARKLLVTSAREGLLVRLPDGEAMTFDPAQAEQLHWAVVHGIDEAAGRSTPLPIAISGRDRVGSDGGS